MNEPTSIWDMNEDTCTAYSKDKKSTDINEDTKSTAFYEETTAYEDVENPYVNKHTENEASVANFISIPELLTNKMAKVYEVNGSTYVEGEHLSKHNDDTLARYELFKVVEMTGDAEDNIGDDDDMTTELDMQIQALPIGLIINSTVFLRNVQWHTVSPAQEELSNCAVCRTYLHSSDFEQHIKSTSHLQNLNKYRPLSRFDLSIVRKVNENLHCGVCNEIFDMMDYISHENSKSHEGNLLTAINKVSDIYDSNVHLNNYTDRNSQSADRNNQSTDRNTQSAVRNMHNTDRTKQSADRNKSTDRNRLHSDRSSHSSERPTADWGGFEVETSWNTGNNPNLDRNIARLARNITSSDRNPSLDSNFPCLGRNTSAIDRDFPALDRNFPSLDRNIPTPDMDNRNKEYCFANSINNNNISVYEDYSDEDEYSYEGEEYNTPALGVSYASMASKPSIELPKFLKIDLGSKEVRVKFESWHMLVKTDTNQFHCMVCNKREHIRYKTRHCVECEHIEKLAKCAVVSAFEDYLIRQVDDKLYHCGHCNNLQFQNQMIEHIESVHPKKNKNLVDDAQKSKKQSEKNKTNEKNTSDNKIEAKAKSESEKSAILNKSLEYKIEKKIEPIFIDIFGDVKLAPFGSELRISALSLNIILKRDGGYYCAICDVVCEDVKAHVEDLDHMEQMNMTPFIRPFKSHLTRAVRGTLHCGLCNKLVQVNQILDHNIDVPHTNALANALGMKKTQKPANANKNHFSKASDLNNASDVLNKASGDLTKASGGLNKPTDTVNKANDDLNKLGSGLNSTGSLNKASGDSNKPSFGLNTPSSNLNKAISELNQLSSGLNKASDQINVAIKKDIGNVLKISECNSPIKTPPLPSPNNLKENLTPKKLDPAQNVHMPRQNMGHNLNQQNRNPGQGILGQMPMFGQGIFPLPNVFPGQKHSIPPHNIQYPYPLLTQNANSQYLGPPLSYNYNIPVAFGHPNNNTGYFNMQNNTNLAQNTEKSNQNQKTDNIKTVNDNNKPVKETIQTVNETIRSVSDTIKSAYDKTKPAYDKTKPVSGIIQSVHDNIQTEDAEDKSDEEEIKVFNEDESVFLKLKTTYFKITNLSFNTLIFSDGISYYCFVCSSTVRVSMLQQHVERREHLENLAKNKFLDKYGVQLFRQMYLMYHCAICNVLMTRKEIKIHLDWPDHTESYETSRKILNKKNRKELKSGIKEYVVETQKEAIFHNVNEPKINLISAYHIVPSLNSLKDTPETTPSKGSKTTGTKKNKMVILNNAVMKVSFDHWHGISKAKNVTKCIICQMELRPKEILDHVDMEYHSVALGKTFEKAYYPALIRKINEMTVNCVICNLELPNVDFMIHEHVNGRKHGKNQETIVNESSSSDSYADCYEDYMNL